MLIIKIIILVLIYIDLKKNNLKSKLFFFLFKVIIIMDAAIRKAKDSLGQIFDKNLHDLVRGIRNHKENEVSISMKSFF
jgi:hypothetical protein